MKKQLTDLIVQRLNESKEELKKQFLFNHPIKVGRHFALDELLPNAIAEKIYADFPKTNQMRLLNSYGELKLKYSKVKETTNLIQDLHAAIQNPHVVAAVEAITGIKNQVPDRSRHACGVSALLKGYYINPHLDNSHDADRKLYRTVNVLYYVSPNWKLENGGNYELWDEAIENRIVVPSLFNRLVVMETNRISWHSVNPVLCDAARCCVFNYFFSEQSPEGEDYFHTAPLLAISNPLFRARPEQKVRRSIARIKNNLMRRLWK
jgi:Rps23 Pro-64 3,4-dihydroxylase Tpa1-like proline 4-hydroxylase